MCWEFPVGWSIPEHQEANVFFCSLWRVPLTRVHIKMSLNVGRPPAEYSGGRDCLHMDYCFYPIVKGLCLYINGEMRHIKCWYMLLVVLVLWCWWINCTIVFFFSLRSAMFIVATMIRIYLHKAKHILLHT